MSDTMAPVQTDVPVELIDPHPDNPRTEVRDVSELAASIVSLGVIEPVVLHVADGGRFWVLAGERRWAAAQAAGLDRLPAVIRDGLEPADMLEVMLAENLHREDLTPIEEARAFARLTELGHSQRDVAARVGCNQSHVSRRLALLELPESVQEAVDAGSITPTEALENKAQRDASKAADETRPAPLEVVKTLRAITRQWSKALDTGDAPTIGEASEALIGTVWPYLAPERRLQLAAAFLAECPPPLEEPAADPTSAGTGAPAPTPASTTAEDAPAPTTAGDPDAIVVSVSAPHPVNARHVITCSKCGKQGSRAELEQAERVAQRHLESVHPQGGTVNVEQAQ